MLTPYWVTLKSGKRGCVEAKGDWDVKAPEGEEIAKFAELPYPAEPRWGEKSNCPSFCYRPNECAGRTCCPQRYACSE